MIRILIFLFIVLWSSAFITGKIIVNSASPFSSLSLRFIIVAGGFFIFSLFLKETLKVNINKIIEASISGILFHGFYLGGVFYSVSIGLPANISALIVSMQPILTNILASPILNEKVTWKQWIGIFFGFFGAILVLGYDVGQKIPTIGVLASIISLIAATTGTLFQKKLSGHLPLSVSNFYQAISASIFLFIIMILFERPYINFNNQFVLSMSWQIFAISFGAFTILMYLIKVGSASKTSNLFFMIPPVSALMAWFFLNENITKIDILGLMICSFGVYISTKKIN